MNEYGLLTVLPLLVMLVMVVATKRVFESMIVSLVFLFILRDKADFIGGIINTIYATFAGETYPWILLMLTLFGGFISLLVNSGGTAGFRKLAMKRIHSQKGSLIFTWLLGIVIFIDDYINNLAIGPTVRGITDKHGVPREALGFVICSTGTPVCSLVPLTAFAVFVFGVMKEHGVSPENSNMIIEYLKLIPYMFYPMFILLVALLFVLGILPKYGAMKGYFEKAKEYKINSDPLVVESYHDFSEAAEKVVGSDAENQSGSLMDFLVPVFVVLCYMIYSSDLVISVILGITSCFLLYIPRKKMNIDDFFGKFFEGVGDMIYILVVILMTFVFVSGLEDIGFSEYVVTTISPFLSGPVIPVLTFITVGLIAFLGVDYWAVMLLIAPIALPLSLQFGINPYLTMAAIASGSVFGGSACLFSEQILMCSQSVERQPVKVALCGLPYNLTAFGLASIAFLISGMLL